MKMAFVVLWFYGGGDSISCPQPAAKAVNHSSQTFEVKKPFQIWLYSMIFF